MHMIHKCVCTSIFEPVDVTQTTRQPRMSKPRLSLPRLATRTLLLCVLASMRSVHWYVEQPSSSLFPNLPYLRYIREMLKHYIPIGTVRLSQPYCSMHY